MGGEETARLLVASRKRDRSSSRGVARPPCMPAPGKKRKKLAAGRSYDLTGSLAILINGPDDHLGRDFSPLFLLLVLWQWLQAGRLVVLGEKKGDREASSNCG